MPSANEACGEDWAEASSTYRMQASPGKETRSSRAVPDANSSASCRFTRNRRLFFRKRSFTCYESLYCESIRHSPE